MKWRTAQAPLPPEGGKIYDPTVKKKKSLLKPPLGGWGAKRSTWDLEADYIEISVRDNGPGIDSEALERIFVPFFSTKKFSSGIGLSLARQIMRLHNGSIAAESSPENGSRFVLKF